VAEVARNDPDIQSHHCHDCSDDQDFHLFTSLSWLGRNVMSRASARLDSPCTGGRPAYSGIPLFAIQWKRRRQSERDARLKRAANNDEFQNKHPEIRRASSAHPIS